MPKYPKVSIIGAINLSFLDGMFKDDDVFHKCKESLYIGFRT